MALTTVPASLSATALTLTTAAQPNITSVGTLTGLTVSGNIAGTLTTAAQTNITSLGTLSALTISGDLTVDTNTLKVESSNNRVLIGKSSTGLGNAGVEFEGGQIKGTSANQIVQYLNRTSSDGAISEWRKDNTVIGFIGSTSGVVSHIVLDPRSGAKGAGLLGSSVDANTGILQPTDKTGGTADGAINLGTASNRFKDGHFSGNITGTLSTAAQTNITSVGTLTGLTVAGTISIGDWTNAINIGASNDLQLYHVGGNSHIKSDTGQLIIRTDALRVLNNANSEQILHGDADGAVTLYYDNSAKLATTSAGINVTGTGTFAGGSTNNNDDANILTLNASEHARLLVDTSSTSGHRATLALESNGNELTLGTTGSYSYLGSVGALGIDGGKVDINKATSFSAYPTGSQLNVYGNGEAIRMDGSGNTSRTLRFRNVSTTNPGIIVSDGSLEIGNEDANTSLSLLSVKDIIYKTTKTNSTAGDHKFYIYNTEAMAIKGSTNQVKIGPLAAASATSAPLHVAVANTDVQAIFGDNNDSIDDPSIRIIGRNSANSTARYTFMGLDADNNYGKIGYNAGAGTFQDAIRMTSEGYVQRPDQPFIRCSGNSASRVTNQGTSADPYTNWTTEVTRGITRSGGVFTVPVAGEYLITYSFYLWQNNVGHSVNHSTALFKGNTMIQESIHEMVGITGTQLWDNTLSNSIILEMSVGDTFRLRVNADIYGGTVHTNMSAYLL